MRSLLIVPPGDTAAFARALASGADAVLSDATAAAGWRGQGPALYLRAPDFDAPFALDERAKPAGFALERAEGGADVQRLGARLAVEEARRGFEDGALRILAFATQTSQAVLGLPSYRGASARLAALIVTPAALAKTLRAQPDSGPVRLARDLAILAARSAGVFVLAAADADPLDLRAARADGFDGMATWDAGQVAVIKAAFAP